MVRSLLVAALLASTPWLAQAAQPVRLAGGAQIMLPEGFSHSVEEDGKTLVLRPARKELFECRLTFHRVAQRLGQQPRTPEEIVSSMAEKKRMSPYPVRGSVHQGFLDTGTRSTVNGELVRTLEGAVALKEGYAAMTIVVPEKHGNDPAVRDFLGPGLESLLATLR